MWSYEKELTDAVMVLVLTPAPGLRCWAGDPGRYGSDTVDWCPSRMSSEPTPQPGCAGTHSRLASLTEDKPWLACWNMTLCWHTHPIGPHARSSTQLLVPDDVDVHNNKLLQLPRVTQTVEWVTPVCVSVHLSNWWEVTDVVNSAQLGQKNNPFWTLLPPAARLCCFLLFTRLEKPAPQRALWANSKTYAAFKCQTSVTFWMIVSDTEETFRHYCHHACSPENPPPRSVQQTSYRMQIEDTCCLPPPLMSLCRAGPWVGTDRTCHEMAEHVSSRRRSDGGFEKCFRSHEDKCFWSLFLDLKSLYIETLQHCICAKTNL